MQIIFKEKDGVVQSIGYSEITYSSDGGEKVVETTKSDLATIFEDAKSNGETLDGPDESIDAAIEDPLSYRDFLVLDSNDEIAFYDDYVRPTPDETQA